MKSLMVLLVGISALASTAQAAWRFDGVWNGHRFTVHEYVGNQAKLAWRDGARGFTAYYNPRPNPALRCPCSVYEAGNGRTLIIEKQIPGTRPMGGWYRGVPFQILGEPQEF